MATHRPVRRALLRAPRRSGLLLAGPLGRFPRPHDAAGHGPSPGRHDPWRATGGGAPPQLALLRGAGGARLDAEGLRGPHPALAPARLRLAGARQADLPGAVEALRGRLRPAGRVGVEPRALARDPAKTDPGAGGSVRTRPAAPAVHGVPLPVAPVVRARRGVPR